MAKHIIRLSEIGNSTKVFTFPSNPEKISGTMGAMYQSFDILSKGTVKVPKGTDVAEIKWDGEFFGSLKKMESIVRKEYYQTPNECIAQLFSWQQNGTILNLIVTNTWINMDVTIASFAPEIYGAYGNVKYSLSLLQYKELKIYTTDEYNISRSAKKTVPRNEPTVIASGGTSYTIVSGDTLWGIAAKKLGNGAKWTSIYAANSNIIEAAAQAHGKSNSDHGHWIYPGTVLTIP